MKNLLKTTLIILIAAIFFQCETKETELQEDLIIRYGSECGWCAGQEYITVSSLKISYIRNIPCGDKKGTITKERGISAQEWGEIVTSFDVNHFNTLEYNNCNVCADGCDEVIEITENENMHKIRYSPSEEIGGIEDLQLILSGFIQEMRDLD